MFPALPLGLYARAGPTGNVPRDFVLPLLAAPRQLRRLAGAGRRGDPDPSQLRTLAISSAPSDLRTEARRDPLGAGAQRPTLRWTWKGSMKPATSAKSMEAVDILSLAVRPEPHALNARHVEARSHLRNVLLPEVAGCLAHAAQPHGADAGAALLSGVGVHRLHIGHRAVAHAPRCRRPRRAPRRRRVSLGRNTQHPDADLGAGAGPDPRRGRAPYCGGQRTCLSLRCSSVSW